jgi:hypothetical protein
MATNYANRGKTAEKAVQDYLKEVNEKVAAFDYERLPDAKAAMGRMKAMAADFEFFAPNLHGLIEVKEVKHDRLLPHKNVSQLPRLKKRILAGGRCLLVVLHTTSKVWRLVDVDNLPDLTSGSWRLDELPHRRGSSLEEVLPVDFLTVPGNLEMTNDNK